MDQASTQYLINAYSFWFYTSFQNNSDLKLLFSRGKLQWQVDDWTSIFILASKAKESFSDVRGLLITSISEFSCGCQSHFLHETQT